MLLTEWMFVEMDEQRNENAASFQDPAVRVSAQL
jgi:hypothetical protein